MADKKEQKTDRGISIQTNNGVVEYAFNKLFRGEGKEDAGKITFYIPEEMAREIATGVSERKGHIGDVPLTDRNGELLCEVEMVIIYPLPDFP